jgi:4-hydroxyphenylpyruvate dioxygenase
MTTATSGTFARLTRTEQESRLDPAELRQLIGLTDYDASKDPFPVVALDASVFVCGNASHSAYYYELALGMDLEAYSGPETGNTDHRAYVLRSGSARFVLKGASHPGSSLIEHHRVHGDGVIDHALEVADVNRCVAHARSVGVAILEEAHDVSDEHGTVRTATIAAFADTVHSLVDRSRYNGPYLPGYVARRRSRKADPAHNTFIAVDHVAAAVEPGRLQHWVAHYKKLMGFTNMSETIEDSDNQEYFAQHNAAVTSGSGRVKFAFSEPAEAKKRSGIDVFLKGYGSAGTQHFAVATRDIVATAVALRAQGVQLLDPPDSYYDDPELRARLADVRLPIDELRKHRILVDRDGEGYLLQVFTGPNGDRPTVFMEWLERHGSMGFGKGNFVALADAATRQQAMKP